ncbi:PREDICTED: ankyrin repeat domain-containing protein 6 [Nicrophorus vespilloides]|uniref:Ankyrin repeat domain-containing protein 6 n=1 Tax=Nicrophorus vespilloides TaxID=110193 RepID=A0ABM1MRX2_NICVS|nr:PREDICTED: ankyrin repeat domain-containing protein 6 [Nicrophorus vespilloides]
MSGGGGGGGALRAAASSGDATSCARLLGNARSVRFTRDELGRSALHLAASAGHGPVIRLLLNVAAPREVDSPDGAGCTPLQRAAADGHEEVVKMLLARGADVDKQDSVHGNSAMHEAAWKGYSRTVSLLATAKANLQKCNTGGFTALHLCCQNGHNQSCRELLLAGCDPDLQNNYGDTALHTAARYGHAGVTRILISAQCRVSEQNKNGDTALHISAAMGRRKLTRILLEAGCDRAVRNKQNETAKDIALRKDLNEILQILDDCPASKKEKKSRGKKRGKSKVRFDPEVPDDLEKSRHWSPYGCHYYPDPEAFPSPRLDSLPHEPLKRGEQYYLDLGGNIRKGPVGVGYTCYCAPLFRHLEAKLEKDKRELHKAQVKLGQRVAGLEQKLSRGVHERRSERVHPHNREVEVSTLTRSRSLEVLDTHRKSTLLTARSMDELEGDDEPRKSVKELVAKIQQQQVDDAKNDSESSDDEDKPLRLPQGLGPMGESNLVSYENVPLEAPRSRSGVYSPENMRYIEPIVKIQENFSSSTPHLDTFENRLDVGRLESSTSRLELTRFYDPKFCEQNVRYMDSNPKYSDLNTRFAKLRMLDPSKEGTSRLLDSNKMFESTTRMLENPQDIVDRDTNNDSGYSTKVYGSSKGNSPSLSGQLDAECIGASSLV